MGGGDGGGGVIASFTIKIAVTEPERYISFSSCDAVIYVVHTPTIVTIFPVIDDNL